MDSTVNLGPEVLTQTVGYDVYGDIEYKSDVGNYDYDANGRLGSYGIPSTTLGYDPNGNVTIRGTQVLTYTPSEKVRTLDGPGVALSFDYDAEGQRVVRHDAANDTTVITLDGMYESRLVAGEDHREERYTVPVPTGSAVRIERTVGPPGTFFQERTRYIHSTYLGSGSVVSAPDGTIVAEVAFDPWGKARDAANWTDPVDDATLVELQTGFTSHAAELDGDLVNMGGRMYDPSIARFVQRDPIVADPANGADYNKYAYVRNRPLQLVDPSGYEPAPAGDEDDGPSGSEPGPGAGADLGGGFHMDPTDELFIPIGARGPYSMGPVFWNGPGQGSGETGGGMSKIGEVGAYIGAGMATAAVLGVYVLTRVASRLCFAKGTLVRTEQGLVAIENVEIGDRVWARDDQTGDEDWKAVAQVFVTPDQQLLDLTFEAEDGTKQTLRATAEHPLWSLDDDEWQAIGELEVGERIEALHGPMRLVSATESPTPETVYNFEVADSHTYFVGEAGVWAHNSCFTMLDKAGRLRNAVSGEFVTAETANAASHIFGKNLAKHKLAGVLETFSGNGVKATRAIQAAAQRLADSGAITGVFKSSVEVAGVQVTVRGAVVNGVARIGTAFIP